MVSLINDSTDSFNNLAVSSDSESDSELSDDSSLPTFTRNDNTKKTTNTMNTHRSFRDHPPMHLLSSGTVPEQETKTITPKTMLSISPPPLPPPTSETKKELYQYLLQSSIQTVTKLSNPIDFFDSGFEAEYNNLITKEMTLSNPIFVAQTHETKLRNRYANILPLLSTAVQLKSTIISNTTTATAPATNFTPSNITTELKTSDSNTTSNTYINANYVNGESTNFHHHRYIACQAPKQNYLHEFWRMVWDEDVRVIAMMTKCQEGTKVKATPYWIEQKGSIQLEVISCERSNEFVQRKILLTRDDVNETKTITHLHFLGWPDFGTPSCGPLIHVLEETNRLMMGEEIKGPTIVHCSAGIGRAMTAICCLIILSKLKACLNEKSSTESATESTTESSTGEPWWKKHGCLHHPLDVQGTVKRVRTQRHGAVVNADQYGFIYRFVLEWLKTYKE